MKALALFGCCAVLAALAPGAWACGVCDEDKIAATYDHAVVRKAAGARVVVFCELGGSVDAARITRATGRVRGVDAASIRVSANPAAMSFALDTARQSPKAALAAIVRAAPRGTRLKLLKVVGANG